MIGERLRSAASAVLAWMRAMPAGQFRVAVVAVCGIAVVAAVLVRDRQIRKRFDARVGEVRTTASAEIAALKTELTAARTAAVKAAEPVKATPVPEAPPRLVTLSITDKRRELARKALPAFDPQVEVEVPFTRFATASHTARFLIKPSALASTLDIAGLVRVAFPRQGVPLKMVELAPGRLAVFFRETFSGRLYLYRVGTTIEKEIRIRGPVDAEPILREAIVHNGRLLAILYDNERMVNEVVALDPDAADDAVTPTAIATLPTLEDPAGRTYEMIPTLRFLSDGQRLWTVGGNIIAQIASEAAAAMSPVRLSGCLRVQDAVLVAQELVVLCLVRANGAGQPYSTAQYVVEGDTSAFKLVRWSLDKGSSETPLANDSGLPYLDAGGTLHYARAAREVGRLLHADLLANHASGTMELGSNNLEGRVAWSQIYFLNGLLDLLLLAKTDDRAFELFAPLVTVGKQRLDLEIYLLNRLVASDIGFVTKGFTVKRVPAIFAVQTSRLLLLFNRYVREVTSGAELTTLKQLRADVLALRGHIDEIAVAGPQSLEPAPGKHYMRWPKGSAFYFDGLNVPYNHQNEWAYAVFDSIGDAGPLSEEEVSAYRSAKDIVEQFIEACAAGLAMPSSGTWPYWWGPAREGWTSESGTSVNTKSYAGDKLVAWISFRSIDAMSLMAGRNHLPVAATSRLRSSIADLVSRGLIYPFVGASFAKYESIPLTHGAAALSYARMTAPSDLQNSVWAAFALASQSSHGITSATDK